MTALCSWEPALRSRHALPAATSHLLSPALFPKLNCDKNAATYNRQISHLITNVMQAGADDKLITTVEVDSTHTLLMNIGENNFEVILESGVAVLKVSDFCFIKLNF